MAASSSSTPSRWMYDVFLSFRGEDTRKNFVDHLYDALAARNIRTFKDDRSLEKGNSISPELFKAIEGSRFAIVIFSRNYAESSWCLDELVKIIECKKLKGLTVIPVFHHANPSLLRHPTGFFPMAPGHHDEKKLSTWRQALTEAVNTAGWDVKKVANGHKSGVIHQIVMHVFSKLDHPVSNIKEDLVGIDSRVDEVKFSLELGTGDVRFIGIWGMGGIGKTTVASALFDNIRHQFESAIFIHEIRERSKKFGLENLQEIMISKILSQRDVKVDSIPHGTQLISSTVCRKKALVILDDVDNTVQVNALAGNCDWFGQGSRIIITTRDKKILANPNIAKIHQGGLLGVTESVELFNLNAFKKIHPPKEFNELADLIVEYAGGLPLALKVLGTFLYDRNIEMWKSVVDRLRDIPEYDIIEKLRVSFDHGLKPVEQEIFLDIACFFKGEQVDYAKQVLDSFRFYAAIGIQVLVEKSLIVISQGKLQMHDLIQEMGWCIVRQVHPRQPEKYNRLWDPQEVCDVLTQNKGTQAVEGLQLDLQEPTELDSNSDALQRMDRLRLLKFRNVYLSKGVEYLPNQLHWLHWHEYPSKSLPATFKAANLVGLELHSSHLEQFGLKERYSLFLCFFSIVVNLRFICQKEQRGKKLKSIDLTLSQELIGTPDFNDIPDLQRLVLEHCTRLEQVHQSIAFHKNLVLLNLKKCINLRSLPDKIQLVSLEKLILSNCTRLDKFPDIQGDMKSLSELYLDGTAIKKLPLSIKCLKNLVLLLKTLQLPGNLGNLGCLEELHADNTAVIQLPASIGLLKKLKILSCIGCKNSIRLGYDVHEPQSSSIVYTGTDIPEHFGNEKVGQSISMELPPQWYNDDFLGFAICAVAESLWDFTCRPSSRTTTNCIRLEVKLVSNHDRVHFHHLVACMKVGYNEKVELNHVLLAYLKSRDVCWPSLDGFQPNNCRLIKFYMHDGSDSARTLPLIVSKGGVRLIYKEDVILEEENAESSPQQLMEVPSPIHEDVPEPATLLPCPPRVQPIDSDTTATTYPGDHPARHHRPGRAGTVHNHHLHNTVPSHLHRPKSIAPYLDSSLTRHRRTLHRNACKGKKRRWKMTSHPQFPRPLLSNTVPRH
ncbi:hypothetical protein RJ640_028461 [Escallonia rubra]|uniref:ADP-ribosyl cyclase/cyclic ADP-ribose hydrolase n=1 Tax=Escallonia rubra TaxID=112253 RepID=A0AA88UJ44_9ASTE|nr:hypothetical protein RJ640_028461 [Escallonia rubra]